MCSTARIHCGLGKRSRRALARSARLSVGLIALQFLSSRAALAQVDATPPADVTPAEVAQGPAPDPSPEDAAEEELEFESVAEVQAAPREPTRRAVEARQLTTTPGTRGDALRAIEIMPGVGRTQFAMNPGPPLLRGSPSYESLVLIDGASIPALYHFGGLTSFFNSHLLESVSLYPGNYSARYGRAAGGVVEARVRDPKSDGAHFLLELSAIDSFVLAEGPLSDRTAIALAARRSNVDLFFDALVTEDSTAVIAAPVYWDYQAILAHRFGADHRLRVMAYGGADSLELYLGEAAAEDPSLQGEFGSRLSLHRLQVELRSRFSEVVEQHLMVSFGPSPGRGDAAGVRFEYSTWGANARAEWSLLMAPWLRVDTGVEVEALDVTYRFEGSAPPAGEGQPSQGSFASETKGVFDSGLGAARSAAFVEASFRPARELLLVSGARVDHASDISAWTLDPRFSGRLDVARATTLKAGVGYYSQPPQYWESAKNFGNPSVKPARAFHTSGGVEQVFGEHVRADVDAFYKRWNARVVGTRGGAPPRYVNDGTGDAYGVELLLDANVPSLFRGQAAYTLSRSTRKDGATAARRLFDGDQTHHLSLTASFDLGGGWQAGGRFRYVTGNPYSAVVGSVYDASTDTYRPLYDGVNQSRSPAFHQLDLRVDKLWRLGPLALTTYLEIMNAYNAENEERRRYSFDYQQSASVLGMPFFPNLGVRGEL